jgi:hypothetical protein
VLAFALRTLKRLLLPELACLLAAAALCSAWPPTPQGASLHAIVALLARRGRMASV